ncbi:hypothetical protein SDRG_04256 [Saprolegnia diclina VS20]|uniref:Uncharacterized protein n=1 Tax=Saprolegnia diclina (strain VS20) TaxID=1156394 RepID=T0QV66_SAPDV|nr:hypothetical protein SDRG_04256 [Saprolegnia diclina VS20]EQC38551.1 hypothetical protein SDRG_04256 [Saprolegnia diclina VS20]|eukprot:XP_008608143.1 hypothetical protein SDRG_04256 [Saprolegnia diclina VS20]
MPETPVTVRVRKSINEAYPTPSPRTRPHSRNSCSQVTIPEIETNALGDVVTEDLARLYSLESRELRFGDTIELHAMSAFEKATKDAPIGFMRWSTSSDAKHMQNVLVVPPVDSALFSVARFVIMPTRDDAKSKLHKTTLRYDDEFVLELSPQTAAECTNTRPPKAKYSLNNKTPSTNDFISAQPRQFRVADETHVGSKGELHVVLRKESSIADMPVQDGDMQVTLHVTNSNRHRTSLNNNVVQFALDTGTSGAYLGCDRKKSLFGFANSRPSTKPIVFRLAKVKTFS